MAQPSSCSCITLGKETIEDDMLILSIQFDPSCDLCAACTCDPVQMDVREVNRWEVYVELNKDCAFCYENFKAEPANNPCPVCGLEEEECTCSLGSQSDGKGRGLRRIGRAFMTKLRTLRRKRDSADGSGRGGVSLLRSLSRRLTGRRKEDISKNF